MGSSVGCSCPRSRQNGRRAAIAGRRRQRGTRAACACPFEGVGFVPRPAKGTRRSQPTLHTYLAHATYLLAFPLLALGMLLRPVRAVLRLPPACPRHAPRRPHPVREG